MPGMVGGFNGSRTTRDDLVARFGAIWGALERVESPEGVLAAHAHAPHRALHGSAAGDRFAIDGEEGFLRTVSGGATPWEDAADGPRVAIPFCGDVVLHRPERREVHLVADWSGAFPLYYHVSREGGLRFSTLLRPLARALGASPDPLGVAEYMAYDWPLAGRTMFEGIRRLEPGQALVYDLASGDHRLRETSEFGIEGGPDPGGADDARIEALWEAWVRAISDRVVPDGKVGVMMSAGWDSRLILAGLAACDAIPHTIAFTHGDAESRELALVTRVTAAAGVEARIRPLESESFSPAFLAEAFDRTEQAVFPHWSRAAMILSGLGVRSVWSGMYAEIMSGVYTPGHHQDGLIKLLTCIRDLSDGIGEPRTSGLDDMRQYLDDRFARRPRALSRGFWDEVTRRRDEVGHDMAATLDRLLRRGVPTDSRFSEAFMTELRATQYLVGQALACRGWTDIGLPFADPTVRRLASQVRITRRFRNRLHHAMMRRHAPGLLRFETAGTIPPASAPILTQELSRWGRVAIDSWQWRRYLDSRGRTPRPRHTWYDYEFLRGDPALTTLVGDLRWAGWDRAAMEKQLREEREFGTGRKIYPDTVLRPYGVDLLLR